MAFPSVSVPVTNQPIPGTGCASSALPPSSFKRAAPASRSSRQVPRLRPDKELRVTLLLRNQPVDERVAVLRRAELRDVNEFRARLLRDRMHAPDAQDVEGVDHAAVEARIDLLDDFLLP